MKMKVNGANGTALLKIKRFIKTASPLPVILALVLVLSLTTGTALGSTLLGWPDECTFQVAVNQQGNIRLLIPISMVSTMMNGKRTSS